MSAIVATTTGRPWLEKLSPECAAAVVKAASTAPALSAEQRDRIAAIMRGGGS